MKGDGTTIVSISCPPRTVEHFCDVGGDDLEFYLSPEYCPLSGLTYVEITIIANSGLELLFTVKVKRTKERPAIIDVVYMYCILMDECL